MLAQIIKFTTHLFPSFGRKSRRETVEAVEESLQIPSASVCLNLFLNSLKLAKVSDSTLRNYSSDISQFLEFTHDQNLQTALSQDNFKKFFVVQQQKELKPASIQRKIVSLKLFSQWVEKNYLNPAAQAQPLTVAPVRNVAPAPVVETVKAEKKNNKYQDWILGPYFHLATLFIFFIFISILGYRQFFVTVPEKFAFPAAPVTPDRILSFQARLTDVAGNPIITATNTNFKLYDAATSGNLLWSSGTCSITPDQDGIFSTILGSTCGSAIASSVFTENSQVWLEVGVVSDTLTPRQRIATVPYALNSETLQGFPVSSTVSATKSTVLVMNQWGEVLLGEQSPTLKSVSGTFTISGSTLNLVTNAGSNGNIILDPDGTGIVSVIGNVVNNGYLYTNGATISATYAGSTPLVINGTSGQIVTVNNAGDITTAGDIAVNGGDITSTGDITINPAGGNVIFTDNTVLNIGGAAAQAYNFIAGSTSGNSTATNDNDLYIEDKFETDGAALFDGTVTLSTLNTAGGIVYTNGSGQLLTSVAGSGGDCLKSGGTGAPTWGTCSAGGLAGTWRIANGAQSPVNDTLDLLIGSNATTSAKFGFLNVNSGTPTASISASSGNIATYLTGDGTLATTNKQSLTIGNSSTYNTTGNVLLNPNGTGFVGIGTSTPTEALNVAGNILGTQAVFAGNGYGFYWGDGSTRITGSASSDFINFRTNGADVALIDSSGNFGIGDTTPSSRLEVGDGTDSLQVSSVGDLTFVDANGAASITGPAGGALNIIASNSQNLALSTTTAGDITQTTAVGTGLVNVLTGNLKVGNGTPDVTLNGEDAYVEGTLEVDGAVRFDNSSLTLSAFTTDGGLLYTNASGVVSQTTAGSNGQCLQSIGGGTPTWATCGANYWRITNGAISPLNDTLDLLIGNTATTSAKFAVINVNSGTPTATLSAGINGGAYLTAAGTLQTTANQALAIGGNSTGDISFSPLNGSGVSTFNGGLTQSGGVVNLNVSSNNAVNIGTGSSTGTVTLGGTGTQTISIANGAGIKTLNLGSNNSSSATSILSGSGGLTLNSTSSNIALQTNTSGDITQTTAVGTGLVNILTGNLKVGNGSPTVAQDGEDAYVEGTLEVDGAVRFDNSSLTLSTFTNNGGLLYTNGSGVVSQTTVGSSGECLQSVGGGTPTWASCGSGGLAGTWRIANGAHSPVNDTLDLLIGSNATASAKFGFLNVNSGTPTASISASSGNIATYLTGDGSLSTTNRQSLTIGNSSTYNTTGNVLINPNGTGYVGIGTTTPGYKLDVNGSVNISTGQLILPAASASSSSPQISFPSVGGALGFYRGAASNNIYITAASADIGYFSTTGIGILPAGSAATPSIILGAAGTTGLFNPSSGVIAFSQVGTESMRIDNAGNIGVGTTAPDARLEINSSTGNNLRLTYNDSNGSATNYAQFSMSSGGDLTINASGGNVLLADTNTLNVGGATAQAYNFFADSTATNSTASTDNDLYVEDKLEVDGAIRFDSSSVTLSSFTTDGGLLYTNGSGVLAQTAQGSAGQCLKSNAGGAPTFQTCATDNYWRIASGAISPVNNTLDLLVGSNATASAKFAVINVNSGTPTASLSANSGNIATYLTGDGSLATTNRQTLTIGNSTAYNTTGNVLINPNGTGFVGIGTTAPGSALEVNGQISTALGSATAPAYSFSGDLNTGIYSSGADSFSFTANGVERFRVTTGAISSYNGSGLVAGGAVIERDAGTFSLPTYAFGGDTDTGIYTPGSNTFAITNGGAEKFRITSGGSVGIGTTGPDSALEINNSTGNNLRLTYNDADGTAANYSTFAMSSGGDLTITASGGNILLGDTNALNVGGATAQGYSFFADSTAGNTTASTDNDLYIEDKLEVDGAVRFDNSSITMSTFTTDGGILYTNSSGVLAQTTVGAGGQCLQSSGGGAPTWGSCTSGAVNYMRIVSGAISPVNDTLDFLVGNSATTSAKFAVVNVNSGTPTASLSAGITGGAYLTAAGSLQTTANQTLTVGGSTTGDIAISPSNSTGGVNVNLGAARLLNILTGNLKVGNASPTVAQDGEDAYIEGTFEVDGAVRLDNASITMSTFTTDGGLLYTNGSGVIAQTAQGSANQCLKSNAGGAPTFGACVAGDLWRVSSGAISPVNDTLDLLVGNTATTSAKFAVINVNSGTPTATLSAGITGGAYLTAAGSLQTTANQTLTVGGSTTGDIAISPLNSAGGVNVNLGAARLLNVLTGNLKVGNASPTVAQDGEDAYIEGTFEVDGAVRLDNSSITMSTFTNNGGVLYTNASGVLAQTAVGNSGECLKSIGGGAPAFGTCLAGDLWRISSGAISPVNDTLDFLVGNTATTSAKFAVVNVNSGTPTATLSAGTAGGAYLTADGTLQTTANQTLAIGGSTTGNITVSPKSGAGTVTVTSSLASVARATDLMTLTQANDGTRDSTGNLLQLTNNDTASTVALLDIAQNATNGDGISFTSDPTTTLLNGSNTALTTGTGLSLTASGLTSGSGISMVSSSSGSSLAAFTGKALNIALTRTYTGNSTVTDTGNFTNIARTMAQTTGSGTFAITGDLAKFTSTCSQSGGTCSDSSHIVNIQQNYAAASGSVLDITNAGTGSGITLTSSSTGVLATLNSTGAVTTADGLLIAATNGAGIITDAIDASDAEIVNAMNVGANTLTGAGYLITSTASGLTVNSTAADLALTTTTSGNINATTGAAAGLFNVLTGNLKVGNGAPTVTQDGEDAYVEGTFEVDGAVRLDNASITMSTFTANGGVLYTNASGVLAQTAVGSSGDCLKSIGGGAPAFGTCLGGDLWRITSGAISPVNNTLDLLVGNTATTSAKFAVINVNSGTPTATLSAGAAGGAYLTADGTLQTTNNQSLNIGGSTTGNITVSPKGGAGTITLDENLISTTNGVTLNANALTTGAAFIIPHTTSVIANGGSLARLSSTSNDTSTTTGTLLDLSSTTSTAGTQFLQTYSGLTTGIGQSIVGNALTTGILFSATSSSTALTSGELANFDWSPSGSTEIFSTGNIFNINNGQYGNPVHIFNVQDNASDVFSVSQSVITNALPTEFTSAGDMSLAYDMQFTNQTSSYVKSNGPLTVQSGESFENNNLTLSTFGTGQITLDGSFNAGAVTDAATVASTTTRTVTGRGSSYYLSANTGTTNSVITTTFNITGAPDVDGTVLFISSRTIKGATGTARIQTVNVQVNGVQISTVATASTTSAATVIENYTAMRANGSWIVMGTPSTADSADYAEYYKTTKDLEAGTIVSLNPTATKTVGEASISEDSRIIGVVSTDPAFIIGDEWPGDSLKAPIGLAGRVPVKIDANSPAIKIGDPISASTVPGQGTKASKAGFIVGRAMEDWTPGSGVDRINIFVNPIYYDPGYLVDEVGNLQSRTAALEAQLINNTDIMSKIATPAYDSNNQPTTVFSIANINGIYKVVNNTTNTVVNQLIAGSRAVFGQLEAGLIKTNSLQTSLISPVSTESLTLKLGNDANSNLTVKNASDEAILNVDQAGNTDIAGSLTVAQDATVAGELSATSGRFEQLEAQKAKLTSLDVESATISGQLYLSDGRSITGILDDNQSYLASLSAQTEQITQQIQQAPQALSSSSFDQFLSQLTGSQDASVSAAITALAQQQNITLQSTDMVLAPDAVFIKEYLNVSGYAQFNNANVASSMTIGNNMILTSDTIASAGQTLFIQPANTASVNILAGLLVLNPNGNIEVNGNLFVSGDVNISKKLNTNSIQPNDFSSDFTLKLATESAVLGASTQSKFAILDASNSAVASIDASGSARFGQLSAQGLVIQNPTATASDSASVAENAKNQTVGSNVLTAGTTELTIENNNVNENVLINLTPTSDTANQVLYLKSKETCKGPLSLASCKKSFTVGIKNAVTQDISFNYWIVNVK